MTTNEYLMENDQEEIRLKVKTNSNAVEMQALWAGIRPGMRVADVGCGPGITTATLQTLVQPGGVAVGIDLAEQRISYAREHFSGSGAEFICRDARHPLDDLGQFDFVWVRFLLEYYRTSSFDIVRNIARIVKPGGILCLLDLDHNCLSHYGIPERMEKALGNLMKALEEKADFDPYVGRKLYSYLFDMGFDEINVEMMGHHVIFGQLRDSDAFNWLKKVEIAPKKINYSFPEYERGYEEFMADFNSFFSDPRRFTYTPIIVCRGRKPVV